MSSSGSILRDIHRLRKLAKGLKDEIDRSPRLLRIQQSKTARQEELYKEAQDTLKHLKVAIHEKETTLKSTHTSIAKHQKQLNEAGGKKEYDALQAEVKADQLKLQQLEEDILTDMGIAEEKTAALPELDKAVKKAKEDLSQFEKGAQACLADLKDQLQKAQSDLKEWEAKLPIDNRPVFERIVASMGEDGFSLVQNNNCTACHTSITSQNYNDLKQGIFVVCISCGRIMYLAE
jgi:uncharacterized protein